MKDFIGTFTDSATRFGRTFLFPSVVALSIWNFFIFQDAKKQRSGIYRSLAEIDGGDEILVLAGAALALSVVLAVVAPTVIRLFEG